jgi:hypothetical protein
MMSFLGTPNNPLIGCSFADRDVMKLYTRVSRCLKGTSNGGEPAVTRISEIDAAKLEELRLKSSIPSVSRTCNFLMICAYQEEYRNLSKILKGEGN